MKPDRLAAAPSRGRALALFTAAALVAALVVTLMRDGEHSASVGLYPSEHGTLRGPSDPAEALALLADEQLRRQTVVVARTDGALTPFDRVTITRGPADPPLILSVASDSPANAADFVAALGPQLAYAATRSAQAEAVRLIEEGGQDVSESRRRRLEQFAAEPVDEVPLYTLGAEPSPVEPSGRLDRAIADLPGETPARPGPLGAVLAILLVSAALWACLSLARARNQAGIGGARLRR